MQILTKATLIIILFALIVGIPSALCFGIYLLLVKLGATKWVAGAIAISIWAIMGISANKKN